MLELHAKVSRLADAYDRAAWHRPGRNQATARMTRQRKWNQDDNRMVMKCNYGLEWTSFLLLSNDSSIRLTRFERENG